MNKYSCLIFLFSCSLLYAAPPENVLTNSASSPTIAGPQQNNTGFIIKNSNTKVEAFKKQKQQQKTATQKALKDQQKGVYPVLQKSPDPYGLNPPDDQ